MKTYFHSVIFFGVTAFVFGAIGGCQSIQTSTSATTYAQPADPLSLIPQPLSLARSPGYFELRQGAALIVESQNAQALGVARYFVDLMSRTRGLKLDLLPLTGTIPKSQAISFVLDPHVVVSSDEGYELVVAGDHIRLAARTAHGLFNGSTTLWQLLTLDTGNTLPIRVPALRIDDAPRFVWRGLMLDVSRHFMPPDAIKQILAAMAVHKLNVFHWHLTDDQGWRIEIKKYPRLTDIGAWRVPAGSAATADIDPNTKKPRREGGFYTQNDVREIVSYAAERFITIVPEIEMPGHAQAAIAAYPQFGSRGDNPTVSSDWGVHTYLYNVNEDTFAFLEDVLSEVMALFPGRYIHVGGDEAAKDQWQASAQVQQRMHTLGVANEAALQSYFIQRIEKFLGAHGRKLIGWDEILEGGLPAEATVMSWQGMKGGIEAANQGHDVVMAPSPDLYLDHLQSSAHDEPPGRPSLITLADVYKFEPVPTELNTTQAQHILGAQINLWTEHMRTPQRVQHATFPRLAALAELTWSSHENRNWNSFVTRLIPQLARYRRLGIDYADSAFAVNIAAATNAQSDRADVVLSNQLGIGAIRYTLDGGEPTAQSVRYEKPLQITLPQTLRANTFADDQPLAETRTRVIERLSLLQRNSDELASCNKKLPLRLEDDAPLPGERAVFNVDILDACWIYAQAPLNGITQIQIIIGQIPYNFQLWHDSDKIVSHAAASKREELQVRLDTCAGEILAVLPLTPALAQSGLSTLTANLPARSGTHDLCLFFTTRNHDPLWAIDAVQLLPSATPVSPK
ncbi:carbohydrate-binding protein [Pseudolysobacter antarcticus]|uniref:beta-N-acetylhexosaminidase n=1 Tax=Pseudolysobacter antarcticus TaxID=2511995 RepID=A0A411HGY3_9GAMM|nr:family 20 glycosylhydrolase [Pseudolysobacter antarcticus]QBB69749.1 carbohydrate-binding protein [Pseudolysobacter antarcticus]